MTKHELYINIECVCFTAYVKDTCGKIYNTFEAKYTNYKNAKAVLKPLCDEFIKNFYEDYGESDEFEPNLMSKIVMDYDREDGYLL